MLDDLDQIDQRRTEAKRQALLDEENHLARIKRVFGTDDGVAVAEWLLELSGYWKRLLPDERSIGRFDLGRSIFNQICMADLGIANKLLGRRRALAESMRMAEKNRIRRNT
jgi:hypothetical protein